MKSASTVRLLPMNEHLYPPLGVERQGLISSLLVNFNQARFIKAFIANEEIQMVLLQPLPVVVHLNQFHL